MRKNPSRGQKIVYTGLFVVDPKLLAETFEPVHEKVFGHHTTIAFKPGSLDGIEVGKRQNLKVIGRAVDGNADALLVENPRSENEHPHITLSVAKGVEPVYSNKLLETAAEEHLIEYFNEPIEIEVVEGYYDGQNDVIA